MRELSFVKKITFEFNGSITKRALVIGDANNDQGELAIMKEKDKFAYADGLGMITACAIGDVMNLGRNFVVAINMEGWLFIFDVTHVQPRCTYRSVPAEVIGDTSNATMDDEKSGIKGTPKSILLREPTKLDVFYEQRMPANCKELLLADLDGDGQNELIIGLTDRVLRTYKWINIGGNRGKFVGLYKWEFADQIGSVSLNPSRRKNCLDIIVAQPGGTYARLECFDKKPMFNSTSMMSTTGSDLRDNEKNHFSRSSSVQLLDQEQLEEQQTILVADGEDNVRTEYISKLTPEYHQLSLTQMRNHHISTEVLGGLRNNKGSNSCTTIVIATLDGTLMLVNKDEILWSLQVDHQLFALAVIEQKRINRTQKSASLPQSESTCTIVASQYRKETTQTNEPEMMNASDDSSRGEISECRQYFVVSAWDGKTYIIDEERNYLRFKFDEAVSAFTAGCYFYEGKHQSALVYATFNNQIVLYYDVIPEDIKPKFLINEIVNNPEYKELRDKLEILYEELDYANEADKLTDCHKLYHLLNDIIYGYPDDKLIE